MIMDIRDLMIGDYVAVGGNKLVIKVTHIGKSTSGFVVVHEDSNGDIHEFSNDEVHPIALTKDILIKNGFVANNVWNGIDDLTYHIEQKNAIKFEDYKFTFDSRVKIEAQFNNKTNEIRHIKIDNFLKEGVTEFQIINHDGVYYVHEFLQMLRMTKAKSLANNFEL